VALSANRTPVMEPVSSLVKTLPEFSVREFKNIVKYSSQSDLARTQAVNLTQVLLNTKKER
jgi:hypothetical protein